MYLHSQFIRDESGSASAELEQKIEPVVEPAPGVEPIPGVEPAPTEPEPEQEESPIDNSQLERDILDSYIQVKTLEIRICLNKGGGGSFKMSYILIN